MIFNVSYYTTVEGDNSYWYYDYLPESYTYMETSTERVLIPEQYPIFLRIDKFTGKSKNQKEMEKYLKKYFQNLQKENIIESYKIEKDVNQN